MKFRFQAIDGQGRVLRGVLRAESEEDARELLLGEEVFPKRLEPAGEDEPVTWAAKGRVKERMKASATGTTAEPAEPLPPGTPVWDTSRAVAGGWEPCRVAITKPGVLIVEASGASPLTIRRERVEEARLRGFPFWVLAVTMLDGGLHEFRAGFLFPHPGARRCAAALRRGD